MPSQHVYNWQKAIYRLELEFKRVVFCSSASSLLQTKQLRAIQTLEAICVRHLELLLDVLHSSTLPKILHLLQTVQVFTWAPEGGILHIYWNDRWSFWVNLTILMKAPLPATLSNTHVWFIFQGHGGGTVQNRIFNTPTFEPLPVLRVELHLLCREGLENPGDFQKWNSLIG